MTNYIKKLNVITDDCISQVKYVQTVDNIHQDFKIYQNLLYKHFYKTE